MSAREDMVLRPSIQEAYGTDAAARRKAVRALDDQQQRGGLFRRMLRGRVARRLARGSTINTTGRMSAIRRGAGKFVGATGRLVGTGLRGASSLINPTSTAALLATGAGMLAYRHWTGATFSQMGQSLNNNILGGIDDQQRARVAVGQTLAADPNLASFVGRIGITDDIRKAAELMYYGQYQSELGKSAIATEFPIVDDLELLVRAFESGFATEWEGQDGQRKLERFQEQTNSALRGGEAYGGGR